MASFTSHESSLSAALPIARAFSESAEEARTRAVARRQQMALRWPEVEPLRLPGIDAFSPYAFFHRRRQVKLPSTAERDRARLDLPSVGTRSFSELRQGDRDRKALGVLFVKRPGYYVTFAWGEKCTPQQRYGLGLWWTTDAGVALQNQSGSDTAWGTQAVGAPRSYESEPFSVQVLVNGRLQDASPPGVHQLEAGRLEVRYPLGTLGNKAIRFGDRITSVEIRHPGSFAEVVPLLVASESTVTLTPTTAASKVGDGTVSVRFGARVSATVSEGDLKVESKRLVILRLKASDHLRYTVGTP
jgi:hypothetical protein